MLLSGKNIICKKDTMTTQNAATTNWRETMRAWLHPRVLTMLLFGFSAGLPILLISSRLSLWLREASVDRSTVTYFSWAALAYSFKFVWVPLVDTPCLCRC
jgi:PAT family beta-lactamase induction signal transducer AmpG